MPLGVDKLSDTDLIFLQTDVLEEEGDYRQVMNYFLVPALAKYKFKNHLYLEGGLQFGWMTNAWVEFNSDVEGKNARIQDFNKDEINKFDTGLMIGFGYTLLKGSGMTLGLKYYYGFVDVYKDKAGSKNSSLFLKMNIPIGAGQENGE